MTDSLQLLRQVPVRFLAVIGLSIAVPTVVCIYLTTGYLTRTDGLYDLSGNIVGGDFVNLWAAAQLAAQGNANLIFDPDSFFSVQKEFFGDTFKRHLWSYPPHTLFLAAPFSAFPYLTALALWCGLTIALFAASLRAAGFHWTILLIILLAPPSFINVFSGQNGFVTVALLVTGWTLKEDHPWWAGVMFGLLTFKPQLGFLIPVALVATREWRPVISACLTTLALVAASAAVFGADVWPLYIQQILPAQTEFLSTEQGVARWMAPTVYIAARVLGQDAVTGYWIQVPFAVLAAGMIYQACRRRWRKDMQLAMLLTAPFLAAPWALNYEMTFVAVAAAILMKLALRNKPTAAEVVTAGAAWILPLAVYPMNAAGVPLSPLILLALILCIWKRAGGADELR